MSRGKVKKRCWTPNKGVQHLIVLILTVTVILFGSFGIGGIGINEANADFNPEINYQGKLVNPTTNIEVPDGNYNIKFIIYDADSGGSCLWTARGSCGSETARTIAVSSGLFSVMLGDTVAGDNAISSLDFNQDLWLGVEVNSDGEMDPRKKLGAVPAAFEADKLDGIDSLSFLRSDEADTMSANEAGTLLTVTQLGAGAVAQFGDGTDYLQIDSVGNIVFVDANDGASITGPAGGTLAMTAGASQAIDITANLASTWKTTAGQLNITTDGASDDIVLTSGKNVVIETAAFDLNNTGAVTIGTAEDEQDITFKTKNFDVDSTGTITIDGTNFTYNPSGTYAVTPGGTYTITSTGAVSIDSVATTTLSGAGVSITSAGNLTETIAVGSTYSLTDGSTNFLALDANGAIDLTSPADQNITLTTSGTGYVDIARLKTPYDNTVTVAKSGGDYTTIQSAVNAITDSSSSNRYFIRVMPGVYAEQVTINDKSYIDVVSEGGPEVTKIAPSSGSEAVTISGTSGYVRVEGFTIEISN